MIGRKAHYVNCRAKFGGGLGYGIARGGTYSDEHGEDALIIAMDFSDRHIPYPVCDITQRLRAHGIKTSVLVLRQGKGIKTDKEFVKVEFRLEEEERERIERSKLLIFHHGNVARHIIYKQIYFLKLFDKPSIVVCQCPIDYEDLAREGVDTKYVRPIPEKRLTKGRVVGIITGVIRGHISPLRSTEEIKRIVFAESGEEKAIETAPEIEEGMGVTYTATGTKGTVEEVVEFWGAKYALINDLYYRTSTLMPSSEKREKN